MQSHQGNGESSTDTAPMNEFEAFEVTEPVSMSWRYSGDVVAHLACKGGCYLDYYCSGNEGVVSACIRDALGELGWIPAPWPKDEG